MDVAAYLGLVGLSVGIGVAVRWVAPSVLARVARRSGVGGRVGWAAFGFTVLWVFAPVLFGARTGEGRPWLVGAAVAAGGVYLAVVAAGSVDAYRLLANVPHRNPRQVTAGEPVAISGVPTPVADGAETPFTAIPTVYTDWLVQHRSRTGIRRTWTAVEGGVETVPFTLGDGAVRVPAGPDRVISNAEGSSSVEPGDPLPEPAASFCRRHPSLPDPDAREHPLRFLETFVPADAPVTVVGTPRQAEEPGSLVVEGAPGGDRPGAGAAGGSEVILIDGDADEAAATLRKRVYGLGIVGVAMVFGGQALAFALSAATLPVPSVLP